MLQSFRCNKCSEQFDWDTTDPVFALEGRIIRCPYCMGESLTSIENGPRVSRLMNRVNTCDQDLKDSIEGATNGMKSFDEDCAKRPPESRSVYEGLFISKDKQAVFEEALKQILFELNDLNSKIENVIRALAAKEPDLR